MRRLLPDRSSKTLEAAPTTSTIGVGRSEASSLEGIFGLSRPRPASENPAVDVNPTSHLCGHHDHDSWFKLPALPGRQGAPSKPRWSCLHQVPPRATLHADKLRIVTFGTHHPVQSHRQLAGDGDLRYAPRATELPSQIIAAQFRIERRGRLGGFHQQPTHHRVALLADRAQALPASARLFARIQSGGADYLFAPPEPLHRTHRQHEGQRDDGTYSGMRHQADNLSALLPFFSHRMVQVRDRPVELVEHPQKSLAPQIGFLCRGDPDPQEWVREQQLHQVNRIPNIGLLLADYHGSNPSRVPHPKFVTTPDQQSLKPLRRNRRFDPDPSRGGQTFI